MEVIDLQILELRPGIVEEGLDDFDIRIHRPAAVVDHQDHLETVCQAAVKDNFDFAGVAHGFADGLLHVDDVPRAGGDHPAQPLQSLPHLERRQRAFLGVVFVPPLHGHFNGRFVPGAPPTRIPPG